MANKIWKEVFLIMCSSSRKNARNTERFSLSLRITDDYALQILCCSPHNVANDEGILLGMDFNRSVEGGYGGVFGPFFVCGLTEDDFCSLPPDQIERFKKKFHKAEILLGVRGNDLITLKVEPKQKDLKPEKQRRPPTQER